MALGIGVVGETIEAGGRIVAATIQGLGSVIGGVAQGLGSAVGGALQGALTEGPIINNFGMAGNAGKQKIVGGGTLPAPKKTSKLAYNEKMPTEKLLAVAVKYLVSIDNTLRNQIENDRSIFQKKVQAEKEAAVENKSSIFDRLGAGLGAAGDYAKTKANKWDVAGKLLKGGLLLGGLGALGLSQLDTSELDALKENVSNFKREYPWLIELAGIVSGAATGFIVGGLFGPTGAIIGAIVGGLGAAGYILQKKRENFQKKGAGAFSDEAKAKADIYFQRRSMLMNQRAGDPTKTGFIESVRAFGQGTAGSKEDVQFLKNDLKKQGYSETQIDTILFGTQDDLNNADKVGSKSETGRPEEARAFFESKGWTKEQSAGIVGNLMVESKLKTDAIGDSGKAYGIAQWHPDRQAKFQKEYGKSIKGSSFREQLEFVNWELNNNEKKAGNALRGATTAQDAAAIVDMQYERSSGAAIAERQSNAIAIAGGNYAGLKGGGSAGGGSAGGGSSGSSVDGMIEMGKKIFGKAGEALIGAQNYEQNAADPSTKIAALSKQVEADTIAGNKQQILKAGATAATASQKSIMQASSDGTLGALDPNYHGGDLIGTYLAHWKLAA